MSYESGSFHIAIEDAGAVSRDTQGERGSAPEGETGRARSWVTPSGTEAWGSVAITVVDAGATESVTRGAHGSNRDDEWSDSRRSVPPPDGSELWGDVEVAPPVALAGALATQTEVAEL